MTTKVFSLRMEADDVAWLKKFAEQFPHDNLNAMMCRFIRTRIEELTNDPETDTPPYPLPKAPF